MIIDANVEYDRAGTEHMNKVMMGVMNKGKKQRSGGRVASKTVKRAKTGSSLGMKSVKSGYDKNPGVTRADFVAIGKGTAKYGASKKKAKGGVSMTKMANMKKGGKCKYGC